MPAIKKLLYSQCCSYVQERMQAAQDAINEAQKASNDDTKSSAGDKYETSREMMQQETNRNLQQLNEANKLKVALNQISDTAISTTADIGSLVVTDKGNFYISISAGVLKVDSVDYFAVSPASPIGLKLKGLKIDDIFILNGKQYLIKQVI